MGKFKNDNPEERIQAAVVKKLEELRWYVHATHGNMYQHGFPDLYCAHVSYGTRWVEIKNPASYHFTREQLRHFHLMSAQGVGIWVVTDVSQIPDVLMKPPNWHTYLSVWK